MWIRSDQHQRPEVVARRPRGRAKEGVAPLVIVSSTLGFLPYVCLLVGVLVPLVPYPPPTPLAAAVLACFGLPLWALAGHKEVGRPSKAKSRV